MTSAKWDFGKMDFSKITSEKWGFGEIDFGEMTSEKWDFGEMDFDEIVKVYQIVWFWAQFIHKIKPKSKLKVVRNCKSSKCSYILYITI
ncbi:unnamed protein product [Rhizophagus irregularis]|uniref:Uncharacterized protein n=1 Tax=Rhizophagus irregularis TaxID=588596 RepID=A0A915ZAB4_9GLOM|nr:unnamed protein product [Rhizophagus irregularis]CAB5367110.1 unnamed protein product [Rhizophagus irregularis]